MRDPGGDLADGGSDMLTITVDVASDVTETMVNEVEVRGDQDDPVANNTTTEEFMIRIDP